MNRKKFYQTPQLMAAEVTGQQLLVGSDGVGDPFLPGDPFILGDPGDGNGGGDDDEPDN